MDQLYNALGILTRGKETLTPTGPKPEDREMIFHPAMVISDLDNPYKRLRYLESPEYVVVDDDGQNQSPCFAEEDPASNGLKKLCYIKPASVVPQPGITHAVNYIVQTVDQSWLWHLGQRVERVDKSSSEASPRAIAVRISGDHRKAKDLDVIYVSDVDFINNQFVAMRNRPVQSGHRTQFENIHFAMNVIDSLAGEDKYFGIRNRQIRHPILAKIAAEADDAWEVYHENVSSLDKQMVDAQRVLNDEMTAKTSKLQNLIRKDMELRDKGETIDATLLRQRQLQLEQIGREQQLKMQTEMRNFEEQGREERRSIYLDTEQNIQKLQSSYKLGAVTYPAIPPLLVGLVVFVRRRLRERAGISKARRLK